MSAEQVARMEEAGYQVIVGGPGGTPQTPPSPINAPSGGNDMDLGQLGIDLLRQAGTAYINQQFGGPISAQQADLGFDIPFVDVIPQAPGQTGCKTTCGPSPVYKKVCGEYKWVYPKRRRRKRLATQSDLKDLAALKGILGSGKAFDTWIATRS